jgi:hypothetical protein
MKSGDCVMVPDSGPIDHPGVILRIEGDMALVAHGSTQDHPWPLVTVNPGSRTFGALHLRETTYFYIKNIRWMKVAVLTKRQGFCPPNFALELKKFTEQYAPGRWDAPAKPVEILKKASNAAE